VTAAALDQLSSGLSRSPGRLLPIDGREPTSWLAHLERYGPLPSLRGRERSLLAAVEQSGLAGRGGAGFPTAIKLRTVAAGRRPVVVANGTEGEPASAKDKALMLANPHLVLDGVVAAAAIVSARDAVVVVSREADACRAAIEAALDERPDERANIRVASAPERFVAGEESALVHWLNGHEAKPTFTPPRPFEKGVDGKPTLVQNVETLANLGLLARYGPDWFRSAGPPAEPGTVLVTVRGAVKQQRVVEVELGTTIRELARLCGGLRAPVRAVLVGGYFGSWVGPDLDLPLTQAALRPLGASLGARTIALLPADVCGIAETARVARYMAGESAGQCGPCVFGLPAVADALETIAFGLPGAAAALNRLPRLSAQIARRGACAHPDGTLRFVESALDVFADEIHLHVVGRCSAPHGEPLLPVHSSHEWK